MNYIAYRRFKGKAICGYMNIPFKTECQCVNGIISLDGKPICAEKSENAHQHFSANGDGQGVQRGLLIQAIRKMLEKKDSQYQSRWDKIWGDSLCQKYKRTDHEDFWLWNHEFFNAPITDLRHIAALVGAKGGI